MNLRYNTGLALVAEAQRARDRLDEALAAWEHAERRATRKLRPGQRHTQAEKQALADAEDAVEAAKRELVRSIRALDGHRRRRTLTVVVPESQHPLTD